MATDIVMDGSSAIDVQAHVLAVRGSDLVLDDQSRRKEGGRGERRALVHDPTDGLTINWDRDYPGGVSIHGVTQLVPQDNADNGRLKQRFAAPVLVVRGEISYETQTVGADLVPVRTTHSVAHEFTRLQEAVDALSQRIAALGG